MESNQGPAVMSCLLDLRAKEPDTPCGVCCGFCQAFRRPVYTSARTFSEMVCVSNHRFQRNGEWRVLRFTLRPQSNLLIRWKHNLLPSNFPSWEWSPVLELHQNPLWPGDREARTRLALPKKKEVRPILRPPRSRANGEGKSSVLYIARKKIYFLSRVYV